MAIMLILQSPSFLYYDGIPATDIKTLASSYQIAARLAFFLGNGLPDETLWEAAQTDLLQEPQSIFDQVERMVQGVDTYDTLEAFHYDWLNLYHLDSVFKDPNLYPQFGQQEIEAMKLETALFVTETLWHDQPYFETLLFSRSAWLHPSLQLSYTDSEIDFATDSSDGGGSSGWGLYELPEYRSGILTRSAFLTAHASSASSSPVRRGAFVLQELLCESLSPPPDVDMDIPPPSQSLPTIRERLAQHSSDARCQACHERIDPVGFAFEHFDAVGAWREVWEGGESIDASGQIDGHSFHDATELISWLGTSPKASRCYVEKWYSYALGRPLEDGDQCALAEIQERFLESGGNIQQLLVDISMSDAFLYLPVEGQ